MNFNYNQEYQTLEITTDSGMTQSIRIPKQYLEKLYFCLWVELNEVHGHLGAEMQESEGCAIQISGVSGVKFSNVRWKGLDE